MTAALAVPLVLLSFKPVEEIDSINYLHYLIEWLSNRATPYSFATNYVAFWELSFAPVWMVTRVDWFFPLLALKALVLMGLGLWLVGDELRVTRKLLPGVIVTSLAMQHYWFGPSGVPTLKNDAMHGAGFVLLTLVILRAVKGPLGHLDYALLAFGASFGAVKYTGLFVAAIAVLVVLYLRRDFSRQWLAVAGLFTATSGHYYLHNWLAYGSPFYPFQINLAFVHLPGTADLSNTSILYSLGDPRLWRALFAPEGGLSPAGLLFPVVLASVLAVGAARVVWVRRGPMTWVAFFLLCGWFLYFRSVFSASAYAGDLAFIRNGLNSIRYVDGVLAVSELWLVALVGEWFWVAAALIGIQLASRLYLLYPRIELFPALLVVGLAVAVLAIFLGLRRWAIPAMVACLVLLSPSIVERNRQRWTVEWNDLKPAIREYAGKGLADLALTDGGYFAGHVVAAGTPFDPSVRSLLPEEVEAGPRPPYLVVLVSPGSEAAADWRTRYAPRLESWGYHELSPGKLGGVWGR